MMFFLLSGKRLAIIQKGNNLVLVWLELQAIGCAYSEGGKEEIE